MNSIPLTNDDNFFQEFIVFLEEYKSEISHEEATYLANKMLGNIDDSVEKYDINDENPTIDIYAFWASERLLVVDDVLSEHLRSFFDEFTSFAFFNNSGLIEEYRAGAVSALKSIQKRCDELIEV